MGGLRRSGTDISVVPVAASGIYLLGLSTRCRIFSMLMWSLNPQDTAGIDGTVSVRKGPKYPKIILGFRNRLSSIPSPLGSSLIRFHQP